MKGNESMQRLKIRVDKQCIDKHVKKLQQRWLNSKDFLAWEATRGIGLSYYRNFVISEIIYEMFVLKN